MHNNNLAMYTSLHDGVQYKITMDNLVQNNHRVLACWVMQRKDSQNGLGQLLLNLFSICNFLFIKGSFIYHIIPISQFVASHYFIIFYRYKGHFTAFLGVHFHIHILITMRTNRVQFHLDMLCMTCSEPSWCFAPLLRLPCIRLHLICKHDRDDDVGDNGDIYIMMHVCLSVTKNHHFLLGVSCNHVNSP